MKKTPLYIYNTLSKEKEEFFPLRDTEIRLYTCGPTVYSRAHIGNMRAYVLSDLIRKTLEYNNYEVQQVINITDVGHLISDADEGEDKLEKAATATAIPIQEIAKKYTDLFLSDIAKLNIETSGTQFPKATDFISEQIAMVQTLVEIGSAYKIDDGIYFDTTTFPKYGALGNIDTTTLIEGERVAINIQKRNSTDFALWKLSKKDAHRQQEWPSPWGIGFPGWHIECSAMSRALLGRQIDIHTGGIDHIPVHHNNEIAQSESINKKQFVHYWMHTAFITIEGRRMGKSIGNLITVDNILDRGYSPLSYRYWLLTAQYHAPANFTWKALAGSHTALKKLHKYFVDTLSVATGTTVTPYEKQFHTYINDDLNTPKAIALVWELVKDSSITPGDKRATLLLFDTVLGLGLQASDSDLTKLLRGTAKKISITEVPKEVQDLLAAREQAREAQDFSQADMIRLQIQESGYTIVDTDTGTQVIRT